MRARGTRRRAVRQAFPNFRKVFPNFSKLFPNFSKDFQAFSKFFLWAFCGISRAYRRKRGNRNSQAPPLARPWRQVSAQRVPPPIWVCSRCDSSLFATLPPCRRETHGFGLQKRGVLGSYGKSSSFRILRPFRRPARAPEGRRSDCRKRTIARIGIFRKRLFGSLSRSSSAKGVRVFLMAMASAIARRSRSPRATADVGLFWLRLDRAAFPARTCAPSSIPSGMLRLDRAAFPARTWRARCIASSRLRLDRAAFPARTE